MVLKPTTGLLIKMYNSFSPIFQRGKSAIFFFSPSLEEMENLLVDKLIDHLPVLWDIDLHASTPVKQNLRFSYHYYCSAFYSCQLLESSYEFSVFLALSENTSRRTGYINY